MVSSDQRILFLMSESFRCLLLRSGFRLATTEELWGSIRVTIGFLVTSPMPFSPDCFYLARRPVRGRVLVVPNFFHLRMMEATVFLDLQCCRNVLVPFPRSVSRHNPVSGPLRTIPSTLWLGFCSDMHCQLWDLRQVCAFPNHVESIEFTTGGL